MRKKEKAIIETLKLNDSDLDKAIKIQGTEFDRKRKISNSTIKKMGSMSKKNKDYKEIAKKLGLSNRDVRYHVDPQWKAMYNARRSGKHTGKDNITKLDRVQYKRTLVAEGKVLATS